MTAWRIAPGDPTCAFTWEPAKPIRFPNAAAAQLGAAAAEMLEALEELTGITPHLSFCEYGETGTVCPECPRCKGEAAIQKARSGQ